MRSSVLWLALAATALSLPGCIFSNDGGPDRGGNTSGSGDVTFLWTFDSNKTCATAGVAHVQITIAGQRLENGGVYDCSTQGTQGIVLQGFDRGSYQYTVAGLDAGGDTLMSSTGSFNVDGDTTVSVSLSAYGYLSWAFSSDLTTGSPTCSSGAGNYDDISSVQVFVDGGATAFASYNCGDGLGTKTVPLPKLTAGVHHFKLTAVDKQGYQYASVEQDVTIATTAQTYAFTLGWEVGSLAITWVFDGSGNTCTKLHVTNMAFNFVDATHHEVFPRPDAGVSIGDGIASDGSGTGDTYACSIPQQYYSSLPAGTYGVEVQGTGGTGGTLVEFLDWAAPGGARPSATVTAGTFGTAGAQTQVTLLTGP